MNMMLLQNLAQTPPPPGYTLTVGGWITMILSVGFVTALAGWCIGRVMRESAPQKLHGPIDIDTHDQEE